ncbi:MAG: hypothetical protein ACUVRU_07105 [Anaerolineae bacterium]
MFDILSEAKGIAPNRDSTPNPDIWLLLNFYESLNRERRKIALEFMQYLAEKQKEAEDGAMQRIKMNEVSRVKLVALTRPHQLRCAA